MGALRRKLLDEELRAFETRSLEITTFDSAEVGRHTQQDSSHIVQSSSSLLIILFVSQQFPTFVFLTCYFSFPPLSSQLDFIALDGVLDFVIVSPKL